MDNETVLSTEKAVLFGAGASSGSGEVRPYSIPLGRDLYSELTAYRPATWGKLPFFLCKLFTRNFEEGMQLMIETDDFSPHIPLLMRDMAEYFCYFTPASNSNL